ncbi:hypothetical protein [Alistipes finegoldii]|uniref:hypothetical protein n=1 Tax=Alistipes finegoldii TaxID=214856 RepID=UPI003AF8DC7C
MQERSITAQRADMLSELDAIEVNDRSNISQADHAYCREQQAALYECLDQLQRHYERCKEEAGTLRGTLPVTYNPNGTVDADMRRYRDSDGEGYDRYRWLPFTAMDRIAELYLNACNCFARRIVRHFNDTYHITVPPQEFDESDFVFGTRPEYTHFADRVIAYLGGESFRRKAEWEIIGRFLHVVRRSMAGRVPELKLATLSFYGIAEISRTYRGDFYLSNDLRDFCAGIALAVDGRLDGGESLIRRFNHDSIDLARRYDLDTADAVSFKFYKNGRIDVRFGSRSAAGECYDRLNLYTLKRNEQ